MLKKFTLLFVLILSARLAMGQDLPPKSNTLVTDYTNALSPEQKSKLENKLVAYADSTSTQIAVVIMKSVGSYDISQYGTELLRAWGIGTKGKNNGILVLVALGDRKVNIQTGYGAEGAVPDLVAHNIIENDIKPAFKEGRYYDGLDQATDSLIKQMKGEYKADEKTNVRTDEDSNGGSVAVVIVIVIVILIMIFRNIGGGGGHIIGRHGGASPFWWLLMGSALGRGSNSGGSGGGFFGGGGSGGGGGFGGFGGGSGGGGGASGSW